MKSGKTSCPAAEQVTHCATKWRGSELDAFLRLTGFKTCQALVFPRWLSSRRFDGLPPWSKKQRFKSKNESDISHVNVWPVTNFTSGSSHIVYRGFWSEISTLLIKINDNYTLLQPPNINSLISRRFLEISKLVSNVINSTRFKL